MLFLTVAPHTAETCKAQLQLSKSSVRKQNNRKRDAVKTLVYHTDNNYALSFESEAAGRKEGHRPQTIDHQRLPVCFCWGWGVFGVWWYLSRGSIETQLRHDWRLYDENTQPSSVHYTIGTVWIQRIPSKDRITFVLETPIPTRDGGGGLSCWSHKIVHHQTAVTFYVTCCCFGFCWLKISRR